MSEAVATLMTLDQFWDWQGRQAIRYELVDGVPWATASAHQRHDVTVANELIEVGSQLRDSSYRVFTADQTVVTRAANGRRLDLELDCGLIEGLSMKATSPKVVTGVLSRSTRTLDQVGKLDGYTEVESIEQVVLADPDQPFVILRSRSPGRRWTTTPAGVDTMTAFLHQAGRRKHKPRSWHDLYTPAVHALAGS